MLHNPDEPKLTRKRKTKAATAIAANLPLNL